MTAEAMRAVEAAVGDVAAGAIVAIAGEEGITLLAAAAESLTPAGVAFLRADGRELTVIADDAAREHRARAALELVRLAGMRPVAAVAEVPTVAGWHSGSRRLRVVSAAAVDRYCAGRRVRRVVEAPVPTPDGIHVAVGYLSADGREHLAFVNGAVRGADGVVVAVCPQCTTGHALRSAACRCGEHLEHALDALGRHDGGIVVYLGADPDHGLESLARAEAACSEQRGRAAADPIALAILADLGPASTRALDVAPEPPAPVRLRVAAG